MPKNELCVPLLHSPTENLSGPCKFRRIQLRVWGSRKEYSQRRTKDFRKFMGPEILEVSWG